MRLIKIYLMVSFCMLALMSSGFAGQECSGVKERLELAVSSAIIEARKCGVSIDDVEMRVSIDGATYRVEMFNPAVRGGGVVVVVERGTAKVESLSCLQ